MTEEQLETKRKRAREYARKWRAENPELAKAKDAARRARDKDKIRAYWNDCKEKRKIDPEFRERERGHRATQWAKNAPKIMETNRRYGLKRYGITLEQYNAMLEVQGGKCAICGSSHEEAPKKRLHVDHCHTTGRVRKLLCSGCNLGIGMFKENPELLAKAIEYLK